MAPPATTDRAADLRRRYDKRAVAWGGAGIVVLGHAMWSMRWAHLYRQRSLEGLGFLGAFAELALASLLLGVATWMVIQAASWATDPARRQRRKIASWCVVTGLVLAWAFAFWVESHGHRCIGSC